MPRDAGLYEASNGSVVKAYLLLKKGSANIPPMWIQRAKLSRQAKQSILAKVLKKKDLFGFHNLGEWEIAYQKECFYYGLRILLELERKGKTKL